MIFSQWNFQKTQSNSRVLINRLILNTLFWHPNILYTQPRLFGTLTHWSFQKKCFHFLESEDGTWNLYQVWLNWKLETYEFNYQHFHHFLFHSRRVWFVILTFCGMNYEVQKWANQPLKRDWVLIYGCGSHQVRSSKWLWFMTTLQVIWGSIHHYATLDATYYSLPTHGRFIHWQTSDWNSSD